MALKRYDLNIGKRMESIELPEEHVVQVIDGGSVSKITDIKQATLEAVAQSYRDTGIKQTCA